MRKKLIVLTMLFAVAALTVGTVSTYSSAEILRDGTVGIASDTNAVVELQQPSTDGPNSGGELVTITNNFNTAKQYTISLQTGQADYDIQRASGSANGPADTISFTLAQGQSATIEYVGGSNSGQTLDFGVDTSGAVSASLVRARTVAPPADTISISISGVTADSRNGGGVTIDTVSASDSLGDIDRIEYEIRDSNGAVVKTYTNTSVSGGSVNISEVIGANLQNGEQYDVTATVFDTSGNSASDTVTVTAENPGGQPPCKGNSSNNSPGCDSPGSSGGGGGMGGGA